MAAEGDSHCQRLLVSMYRLAAVQLLEQIADMARASCTAMAADGSTADAPAATEPPSKAPNRWARAREQVFQGLESGRKREAGAKSVWAAARAGMHTAVLVLLGPGDTWKVASSMVLLQGGLSAVEGSGSGGASGSQSAQEVQSPCLVPWAVVGEFTAPAVTVRAGVVPPGGVRVKKLYK